MLKGYSKLNKIVSMRGRWDGGEKSKFSANSSGFSFVEILISLFILGVMLLLYAAASNSTILNNNTRHKDIAQRIAITRLETLRSGKYINLPSSGPFSDSMLSSLPKGQAQQIIVPVNSSTKQVTVTVSWQEPGNTNIQSIQFDTLITRNGL